MGPSIQSGIDTIDWKTQLPPDSRQKIVNKIMETLRKRLPFPGPEGINELRRIAAKFEEKMFSNASNQTDYLRNISMKMLTMETKSANAVGSSSSSSSSYIHATNNSLSLNPNHRKVNGKTKPSLVKLEIQVNIGDWRTHLPPDSRHKNAKKIMDTLRKHVGQEGTNEVMRIALSFEDLIFKTAIDQVDYFRKISFKIQTMEEGN